MKQPLSVRWIAASVVIFVVLELLVGGVLTLTSTTGVFVLATVLAVVLLLGQIFGPIGRTSDPAPSVAR